MSTDKGNNNTSDIGNLLKMPSGSSHERKSQVEAVLALLSQPEVSYTQEQIAVFDEVLIALTHHLEMEALAGISMLTASIANAPTRFVGTLASNSEINIAEPVLKSCSTISDDTLMDIANKQSDGHLLAISKREALSPSLSDILIERGSETVLSSLIDNLGAKPSPNGFNQLGKRVHPLPELAERLCCRDDVPREIFIKLVTIASEEARQRIRAKIETNKKAAKDKQLDTASSVIEKRASELVEESIERERDFAAAQRRIDTLSKNKELEEADFEQLAQNGDFNELIVAFAKALKLPLLTASRLLLDTRPDSAIMMAKALNFEWMTTRSILFLRAQETNTRFDVEKSAAMHVRIARKLAIDIVDVQRRKS